MRRLAVLLVALALGSAVAVAPAPPTSAALSVAPRVAHVWIIVFENTNYAGVTPQSMPYFTAQAKQGVTLTKMYGVGHASLDNYLAMVSGHAPNPKTQADCFQYDCVYGSGEDSNVANQLEAAGFTWKGYMDGMTKPCQHSVEGKGEKYAVGYAARHDPFVYYRSIVGDAARCDAHVVPYPQLATDLASGQVPSYSFVTPDTCHDAHDASRPGCSLHDADTWLSKALPPILGSDAYKQDGAVFLTFDEADADASGCCGGPGGGHIATAVLSPRLVQPGTSDATPYSHYSLLRTIEDNFGLECLRHACDDSTHSMINLFRVAPPSASTTTGENTTSPASGSASQRATSAAKPSSGTSKGAIWGVVAIGALLAVGALMMTRRTARRLSED